MDKDTLIRRLALSAVIGSATVLSYTTMAHRAESMNIEQPWSWFYPLVIDGFILASSRVWHNEALSNPTRRLAKWFTISGIGVAIAAFVAEYVPTGPVNVGFAVTIPIVLALTLILTSKAAADSKRQSELSTTESHVAELSTTESHVAELSTTEVPVINEVPDTVGDYVKTTDVLMTKLPKSPVNQAPKVSKAEQLSWIHDQLSRGVNLKAVDVDNKFPTGTTTRNGYRYLKQAKEELANEGNRN